MQIQLRHGFFPRIVGKGDNARRLADLLLRMRKELDAEEYSGLINASGRGLMVSSSIENLIIIDRDIDFATVLLTQLTYEGLLDELFGISNNQAEVDSNRSYTPTGPAISRNVFDCATTCRPKTRIETKDSIRLF